MKRLSMPEALAYVAGYFDGEGSVSISTRTPCQPAITAANTNLASLEEIADFLAAALGIKCTIIVSAPASSKRKQVYCLHIDAGESIRRFCSSIIPYSTIKKERLALVLEYLDACDYGRRRGRGGSIPDEDMVLRLYYAHQMKLLNE